LAVHPTIQEGTTDVVNTTLLQQRLNALHYDVGTPDGVFGAGTKAQVVKFQTDNGITPADGVVNAATWDKLLANPSTSPTTTTKAK
jgi:peptidoglycan hydrolase-like protein with peptidoglycan-binding domain